MKTTGLQLLLDLHECQVVLNDATALETIFRQAIQFAGFETVERTLHLFPDQGITLVFILAQSHATLHTWPEAKFATVDVYACGDESPVRAALEKICAHLAHEFAPHHFVTNWIKRG